VPDDIVDREVDRIRESFARLEPVERPAADGDALLIDYEGFIDGAAFQGGAEADRLIELGSGRFIEGFERQLAGARGGEERRVEVTFPDDYGAEHLAGKEAVFDVKVREVREKVLPELDDDFASEASEFDTLGELRADIAERLGEAVGARIEQDFRLAAVDAAVDAATVELPDDLVEARAEERLDRLERQLSGRGMDPSAYFQMQGKTREELVEETKPDAATEIRRDAVLAAIADAEEIEVDEEEMLEALAHTAEHERTTPEKLLERLRKSGRDEMVREDIRIRKAIDVVADAAKPIPVAQAEAREALWTPEKERDRQAEGDSERAAAGGLWTPGED
jgi:trigger factor